MRIILNTLLIMASCHTMTNQEETSEDSFVDRGHYYGTMVNFDSPKVQGYLQALMAMAISCRGRVRATLQDVRAYLNNAPAKTREGQCFVACMFEASDIIYNGKVDTNLLVHLTSLVNGKDSRVVASLRDVSKRCLIDTDMSDEFPIRMRGAIPDKCEFASTYSNCLNDNMKEHHFPSPVADIMIKEMSNIHS